MSLPMRGAHDFMQHRLLTTLGNISAATGQLRAARSIAQLIRAKQISVPPELRHVVRSLPEMRRFTMAAEDRSLELIKSQLSDLSKVFDQDGSQACLKALSSLQRQEWCHLPGNFPRAARMAQDESRKLMDAIRTAAVENAQDAVEDGESPAKPLREK